MEIGNARLYGTIWILAIGLLAGGPSSAQYVNQPHDLVPQLGRGGDSLTTIFKDGLEFLKKGECKKAEKKFLKVLDKVPRSSEANYLAGVALQCQKDWDSSLTYFRRAKRDDAQYYRAYEAFGVSALALGSRKHAQAELDELQTFIDACGQKCPPLLLQSHQKLVDAIAKFDGVPVQSSEHSGETYGPTRDEATRVTKPK
jgi:tetratricopeptide (TPR) repeat protein